MHIPGLSVRQVRDTAEVLEAFEAGNKTRATAATLMNAHSSRSHMVKRP